MNNTFYMLKPLQLVELGPLLGLEPGIEMLVTELLARLFVNIVTYRISSRKQEVNRAFTRSFLCGLCTICGFFHQ